MSETYDKQKVVIGDLVNEADALAKKVLSSYNPTHSYNNNLANVMRCSAKQLESCAELCGLKVRSDDGKNTKLYSNKELLSDRIILKIESLFEAECCDCSSMYQNTLESKPLFTCRLCLLGSHDCDAIKEKAESMSLTNPAGTVWLCNVCMKKNDLQNLLPEPKPRKRTLSQQSSSKGGINDIELGTISEEICEETEETGTESEKEGDDEEEEVEDHFPDQEEKEKERISPRKPEEDVIRDRGLRKLGIRTRSR